MKKPFKFNFILEIFGFRSLRWHWNNFWYDIHAMNLEYEEKQYAKECEERKQRGWTLIADVDCGHQRRAIKEHKDRMHARRAIKEHKDRMHALEAPYKDFMWHGIGEIYGMIIWPCIFMPYGFLAFGMSESNPYYVPYMIGWFIVFFSVLHFPIGNVLDNIFGTSRKLSKSDQYKTIYYTYNKSNGWHEYTEHAQKVVPIEQFESTKQQLADKIRGYKYQYSDEGTEYDYVHQNA